MRRWSPAVGAVLLAACASPAGSGQIPEPGAAPAASVTALAASAAVVAAPTNARQLWVDPVSGRDTHVGTRAQPLRTVAEAWRRVPARSALTRPVWIQLRRGSYPVAATPHYWEHRWGTPANPVVLNSVDGAGAARFAGDINAYDVRHLQVLGVAIVRSGDTFHCERCSHLLLDRVRLDGRGAAHETVKVNQSHHVVIRNSEIGGAEENAIDFVAVQHAAIVGNRIHHAGDWCAYVKGGSAYVLVRGNRIHHCGTGGFTAGQGTGFEFMVAPWLRYETYGVTVVDNIVHDTEGAGLGVNGGYNTVFTHNTLYRVGRRSHAVEFVHGARSCDGDTARCRANRQAGGWGGVGVDGQYIPNRHTYFVNNVILNPSGYRTQWQHIQLADPVRPPAGSGVPSPARADADLVIRGNVFRNGGADMPTGLTDDSALRMTNRINTITPDLVDPADGDFRPRRGGVLAGLRSVPIPQRDWADSGGVPAMTDPVLATDRPPGALRPPG